MTNQTDLVIERVLISSIRTNPRHTRKCTAAQIKRVKRSIQAFGYNVPVLVDRNGQLIAGHVRVEALRALGYTEVLAIRLEHLTPEQVEAFAIAENRLVETGEFDDAMLGLVLKDLSALDLEFSLDVTGFSMPEIDLKIDALDQVEDRDADEEPVRPGPAVVKLGDLWTLGRHRMICGSALETQTYERLMQGDRAAMVFTDPPYGVGISGHVKANGKTTHREFVMGGAEMSSSELTTFFTTAWRLCSDHSVDGSLHYAFIDGAHLFEMLTATHAVYDRQLALCVWSKPPGMGSFYRHAHELVVVSKKGKAPHRNNIQLGKFGRNRTTVWSHSGAGTFLRSAEDGDLMAEHPTPKPTRLVVDALLDASSRGDVILEPFCGSGSTLIAAERTGRRCRAIELDPLYCDLIIRRWQRHTGDVALREDGVAFNTLEQQEAA